MLPYQKYDTTLIWLCMFSMIYRTVIPLLLLSSHEAPTFSTNMTICSSRRFVFHRSRLYVPYNHIEVLYHVKTRTNGPCLHASFVRVESAMFDRAWIRARLSRVRCLLHARVGTLIFHPHDSRLGLFNLTSSS